MPYGVCSSMSQPSASRSRDSSEPIASASTSGPSTPIVERTPSPPPEPEPEPEEEGDILIRAEKVKEQGNVAFKAKRFGDAIDLYTKAIGMP